MVSKKQAGFSIIYSNPFALAVLAVFVIMVAWLGYSRINYRGSDEKSTANKQDITGWGQYSNEEYGFSFEYPADVKLITQLDLDAGRTNMQKNWHLLLTNQEDYLERVANSLEGEGYYYIQIEVSESESYTFPFKGRIAVTKSNFSSLFGGDGAVEGLLAGRPTLKFTNTAYPNKGQASYIIYDKDRVIEVTLDSDNLDIIPFSVLDRIITSFSFLEKR